MLCAYSKCSKEFNPSHGNQIYHSRRCRLEAKSEKTVLVRVPADQARFVRAMLARWKSGAHRLSLLLGAEPCSQTKKGGSCR